MQKEVRDVQLAISRQVNVRGSLYRLIKLNVAQKSSIGLVDLKIIGKHFFNTRHFLGKSYSKGINLL